MIGAHIDVTALKAQEAENLEQEREQKIAFQQQEMLLLCRITLFSVEQRAFNALLNKKCCSIEGCYRAMM